MRNPWRAKIKNREALAIRADIDILSLLVDEPPPTEIIDGVGILYIRGPLEHHDPGCGDSYERICHEFHELEEDPQVKAIIMCIDSPGGLVSGLNETVYALQEAKTKPVYAYVDEMATSAAYAIACIADEIFSPPSAISGSIGVISTIASQSRANEKAGLDYVTITSGARKADGHPNVPIDEGAINAEQGRVESLAAQFFKLVQRSRGLSPDFCQSLEAGIFLGDEAVALGIVDEVMGFNELLENVSLAHAGTAVLGLSVDRTRSAEVPMLTARAKIAKLQAKLVAATSKKERKSISAELTKLLATLPMAMKKTSYRLEEEETVEDEEEEEEEGGNETDREEEVEDEDEKAAVEDEEEEEAMSAEGDDDKDKDTPPPTKEKKAAKALAKWALSATGAKSLTAAHGKLAALVAKASKVDGLEKRLSAIETERATNTKSAVIRDALRSNRITPAEASTLAKKDFEYIEAYLDGRPAARVLTPEQALRPLPRGSAQVAKDSGGVPEVTPELSEEQEKMLADVSDPKLRAQIIANWAARLNGASREA